MAVDLTHPERPSTPAMTGAEMQAIRKRLGLSTVQLGRAIGYVGADNTVSVTVRRYESDGRDIPPWIARLLIMFDRHGVPEEFK
ncbi:helix-turn-helix domain-containing protein [Devosia submarina]|uniref:helix-turn-helix domain-containing protein n=1 Tax=Devosia submarina TaxID=1173082 RepID=UPI0013004349|nr:hypothetical protein [Devosia submarina]